MAGKISELTNLNDPLDVDEIEIRDDSETPDTDAQNKALTIKIIKGLSPWKQPARIATEVNDSLSGLAARDGITPVGGDRVLVKAQTAGEDNGLYEAASGAWTRSNDFDTNAKAIANIMVQIEEGTANADKIFQLTTNNPITIGSTSLTFAEFIGGGGGEINTSSNVGTGQGLAKPKVSVDLPFKSLLGTASEIDLTGNVNDVTFSIAAAIARLTTKLDDFGTPDDNTDLDATTSLHGLFPKADKVKLDGISALAEVNPDLISQAEAEAGVATTERIFSALRVKQAIDALGGGGDTVVGTQQFSVAAGNLYPGMTSPADAIAQREVGANVQQVKYINFPGNPTGDTVAYLDWFVPENIDLSGTIKIKLFYTTELPSAAGDDYEIEVSGVALENDDAIGGTAFGTPVAITDTFLAVDDVHSTPQSADLDAGAIGGTLAKNSWVQFKFLRDVSFVTINDGPFQLIGAVIEYTIDLGTSSG